MTITRRIAILTAAAAVAVPAVANAAPLQRTTPIWATKATVSLLDGRITASHPGTLANRAVVRAESISEGMGDPGLSITWRWAARPANGVAKVVMTTRGLADDAIAGEVRTLNMRRVRPGVWRLDSATVSRLCWRGVDRTGRRCV